MGGGEQLVINHVCELQISTPFQGEQFISQADSLENVGQSSYIATIGSFLNFPKWLY